MRQVRLTFGDGQALVLAAVVASACGGVGESSVRPAVAGSPNANGGANSGSGMGRGGTMIALPSGGASTSGGASAGTVIRSSFLCRQPADDVAWADCEGAPAQAPPNYPFTIPQRQEPPLYCHWQEFIVPVAPEGVSPTISDICASAVDSSRVSSWASRVTLTDVDISQGTATGRVALAKGVAVDSVVSADVVLLESDPGFGIVTIGAVARQGDVFVFPVNFGRRQGNTSHFPRLVFEARLTVQCGAATKTVLSSTAVYQCEDSNRASVWISSGDACGECAVICEMAASPIVPPTDEAGTEPLLHAVRPHVVRIGQYGGAILLQAQHDGGPDRFTYAWDVSDGQILWQEKDLLLWQPPGSPSESHVQIALVAEDAAAVASCRVRTQPLRPV